MDVVEECGVVVKQLNTVYTMISAINQHACRAHNRTVSTRFFRFASPSRDGAAPAVGAAWYTVPQARVSATAAVRANVPG
jgi:hypothetical protein